MEVPIGLQFKLVCVAFGLQFKMVMAMAMMVTVTMTMKMTMTITMMITMTMIMLMMMMMMVMKTMTMTFEKQNDIITLQRHGTSEPCALINPLRWCRFYALSSPVLCLFAS